jgi:hypothetical protein
MAFAIILTIVLLVLIIIGLGVLLFISLGGFAPPSPPPPLPPNVTLKTMIYSLVPSYRSLTWGARFTAGGQIYPVPSGPDGNSTPFIMWNSTQQIGIPSYNISLYEGQGIVMEMILISSGARTMFVPYAITSDDLSASEIWMCDGDIVNNLNLIKTFAVKFTGSFQTSQINIYSSGTFYDTPSLIGTFNGPPYPTVATSLSSGTIAWIGQKLTVIDANNNTIGSVIINDVTKPVLTIFPTGVQMTI